MVFGHIAQLSIQILFIMLELLKKLPSLVISWISPNLNQYFATKQPLTWFLALAIGLLVSVLAIFFRESIGLVQLAWLGSRSENVASLASSLPWYVIVLAPTLGGLIVGIILTRWLNAGRTSGVADVIEARTLSGRKLNFRDAVGSAATTAISLGSGASAGREGPVVHLGASAASSIARRFDMPQWCDRTLLACGVASAVSSSFNAPFAGVIFAHEVILGHYAMRAFVPIVIASVAGTLISRQWFGDSAAFFVPEFQITSLWEFPAFVLLGVVCAAVSVLFQFSITSAEIIARNFTIPLWLRPTLGGLIIGLIGIYFPQILGVGYETTDQALHGDLTIALMLSLLVAKTAATAITLASRFGGGVFSPALYLGAMTGGAFGLIAAQFFPDMASSQALYSLLGMGAVAAAVLGAPISTTLIVFELIGGYAMTVALLLAVSISNGINHAIHGHSIFQWQLEMRGLFLNDGPQNYMLRATRVMDFMTPPAQDSTDEFDLEDENLPKLRSTDTLESALRAFDSGTWEQLPVVGDDDPMQLVGVASQLHALRYFNSALIKETEERHQH